MRVAVVGAGISGLVAAHVLAKSGVEVVLYEKKDHLGGHAMTITFDGLDLNLAFIDFNNVSLYNNYIFIFEKYPPRYVRMPWWTPFNNFIIILNYLFCKLFFLGISFFFLVSGLSTVEYYSGMVFTNYVNKVKEQLESWGCQIRIGCEVYSVSSADGGFTVVSKDGSQEMYSGCIMAVHAPDALKMLGSQATFDEKRVLGAFQYANIDIFLHRDKKFMPQDRAVWSACNFVGNADVELDSCPCLLGKSCAISTNPRRCMVPSLMEKAARHFVVRFLGHYINTGHLILLEEGATTLNFKGTRKSNSLKTILRVHNLRFYWKFMIEADIGLADSYIVGDFSFEDKDEGLLKLIMVRQLLKSQILKFFFFHNY
ncbi:hypothetical protein ACOSQ2_014205 [Xanthoceras sorbifolium]